jgi:hypothetical protein
MNNEVKQSQEASKEPLESVMKDLSEKVNQKSTEEGVKLLAKAIETNNVSVILEPMKAGADEFEKRTGRPPTYAEMRAMWG